MAVHQNLKLERSRIAHGLSRNTSKLQVFLLSVENCGKPQLMEFVGTTNLTRNKSGGSLLSPLTLRTIYTKALTETTIATKWRGRGGGARRHVLIMQPTETTTAETRRGENRGLCRCYLRKVRHKRRGSRSRNIEWNAVPLHRTRAYYDKNKYF